MRRKILLSSSLLFVAALARRREQLERQREDITAMLAEIRGFEAQSRRLLAERSQRVEERPDFRLDEVADAPEPVRRVGVRRDPATLVEVREFLRGSEQERSVSV